MRIYEKAIFKKLLKGIQAVLGLVVITILFLIFAPSFRQWETFASILEQSTVLAIMAAGTTIVLISGGLDLSVGSVFALVACVGGSLLIIECPVWLVVVLSLLVGLLCGFVNGAITVFTKVPPFIVTLGMMNIARGVAMMVGSGKDMSYFPEDFKIIGSGFVGPVIIMVLTFIGIGFILSQTKTGFNAYSIGGNEEVARLSGIKIKFNRIVFYSIGGLLAGFSALVQISRFNFATPNLGNGWELQAIAAVVIGGTSLWGGMGGVGRTLIGVFIVKTLEAGLIHLRIGSFWQKVAIGVVIILAVWIDHIQRQQKT